MFDKTCFLCSLKPRLDISHRLKDERIIVSIQGSERNIIALTPPMCFNIENARRVIEAFDKALEKVNANEEEVESPVAGPSSFLGYQSYLDIVPTINIMTLLSLLLQCDKHFNRHPGRRYVA